MDRRDRRRTALPWAIHRAWRVEREAGRSTRGLHAPSTRRLRLILPLAVLFLLLPLLPSMAATSSELVFVVDGEHEDASDSNAGTSGRPLATVGRALELADAANRDGVAVRVEVRDGTYREELRLGQSGARTDAPLTIEGTGADRVVIDGADIRPDGQPSARVPGAHSYPWHHNWGLAPVPTGWSGVFGKHSDLIRRSEAVWVQGEIMRQVLSVEALTPGTFHVDEDRDELTLLPPQGVHLDSATVEVTERVRALDVDGWDNVTVRGITFRRAASPVQRAGVRFIRSRGIVIDEVRIEWNNWTGLAFHDVRGASIRRTALARNGVLGLVVHRSEDLTFSEVDSSYNNTWRGPWAEFYGWEAGSKVYRARGLVFDRWYGVGNQTYGLWLDTDVADVVIRRSFLADNLRSGLFLEALQGPVLGEDNTICQNGREGVLDGKSDDVTLDGNRIFANSTAQIAFSGEAGGRAFTTYDTGKDLVATSRNWVLRGNTVEGAASRVIGNNLNADDWAIVRDSLHASGNRYHHASDPRPFTISGAIVDFSGWKAETGEDGDSTFSASPSHLLCEATPPPTPTAAPMPATDLADGADVDREQDAWDGDRSGGLSGIGLFHQGTWRTLASGNDTMEFSFGGRAGEVAVVGDWNGDGHRTPGLVRNGREWYLSNHPAGATVDHRFRFGRVGDVPVVGDWNGDGRMTQGVVRDGRYWFLSNRLGGATQVRFTFGRRGDLGVVGDWNGDGRMTQGVVRDGRHWFLSNRLGGATQVRFTFGRRGDLGVVGDWNRDGRRTQGVFRDGDWFLSSTLAGPADQRLNLGSPGLQPVSWR